MNTIKDLAVQWWESLPIKRNKELLFKYHPDESLDYKKIENIFYNEVILKWWFNLDNVHQFCLIQDYPHHNTDEIYLKEHTKEQPKHNCRYSKAMNQPYPRLCVDCGKPEQPQLVDNTIDVEEVKVFNDFEEWIVVRLAETGFKGFNFDERKEIVDKAMESREKRKAIEDNVWDEAFKRFHKNDIPDFVKWELKENYLLIKL